MKPGEGQAGPLTALATALLAPDALPELAHGDYPPAASLADSLRRGGTASVQPISSALARVAEAAQRERHADQPPKPALVLLVDQFEELFAQRVSDAERAAFAESLQQLITTRQVWLTATLRADFYELLLKQPVLKALKETGASLDLGPPGPAELAEIVRAPAAAAGLVFGTDTEKGELGDRLLADAKSADSLPLLQFTLRQLYERRGGGAGRGKLTHAGYDQLGGLWVPWPSEGPLDRAGGPPGGRRKARRVFRRGPAGRAPLFRDGVPQSGGGATAAGGSSRHIRLHLNGRRRPNWVVGCWSARSGAGSADDDNSNREYARVRFGNGVFCARPAE